MKEKRLRVAVVGCGAVTERCHLPVLVARDDVTVTLLVDRNRDRAEQLAARFDIEGVEDTHAGVHQAADAAIVAVPHALHAPVSLDLLGRGVHVLVEKPMALNTSECDEMIAAADANGVTIAVGLMRRFLHSARFARRLLGENLLGPVRGFDFREGNVYNWKVASDGMFRRDLAGGGVLMDTGAHTLDLLLWWLGEVAELDYADDAFGGVEADCELRLTMASGVTGIVELSRTRTMRNTAVILCERGRIEADLRRNKIGIQFADGESGVFGDGLPRETLEPEPQGFSELFVPQAEEWLSAIRQGRQPLVNGREGRRSVALIEACYAKRRPLRYPWTAAANQGEYIHA